jgi:signal transduction histidine kinase
VLRRLLTVVVPLLVALFVALGVPLAANLAQRETQSRYLDRLGDAERFATLTDDELRRGHSTTLNSTALAAELRRYDDLFGISVAVYAVDGRLLLASRTGFDASAPGVKAGLATADAGYRPDRIGTVWPWRPAPMVVVEPVGRDSGVIAAVVVVSPSGKLRSAVLRDWGLLAALGIAPFLLAVAIAVPLSRWVLRPVRDLDDAAAAVAAGRLDARAVTEAGPPELRRLATSFNVMVDIVGRTLRRQRTFVADASHQLRNPLASLRLAVENLGLYVTPAGQALHTDALTEVADMGRVVDALLALTEVEGAAPATTPQPLAPTFAGHGERWRQVARSAGMALTLPSPQRLAGLATYAPAEALASLLDELVGNAARLSGGTTVTIDASLGDEVLVSANFRLRTLELVLTVRDDGAGLSAEDLAKATNRFWRGRAQQNVAGTGLGLAICRELVEGWTGRLTLHPVDPHGLAVRVTLPAAAPDSVPAEHPDSVPAEHPDSVPAARPDSVPAARTGSAPAACPGEAGQAQALADRK